ncbi:MAG: peroxiredoxin [Planctomycetota bacterium]
MLKSGDTAPPFDLPAGDGGSVSLSALLERGPAVLYFYPADFTPGCTAQACMVRDLHGELVAAGVRIVGISPQPPESHKKFAEKFSLPFTLLCDRDKTTAKAYGVNGPFGIGVRRATFLISTEGVIEDAVLADLNIGRHKAFLNAAARGAGSTQNE